MVDHAQTITNTLTVYGIAASNKWGTFLWGENWGEGTIDLAVDITVGDGDTMTLGDSWTRVVQFNRTFSESISTLSNLNDLTLTDANGYDYIFTKPTNDGVDRSDTSYSVVSGTSATWAETSDPGTGWGAA